MARDDDMMTPDDSSSDELVPAWTPDGHLGEGTIHTWLDGAFDEAQSAIVTAHVDGCARCSESVAEARGFIAGASRMVRSLDAVPSEVVPHADVERVASRIVAAAVADVTRTTAAPARVRRAWYTQPAMRAAAAILVVVGGGTYVWSRTSPMPVSESRVAAERSVVPAAPLSEAPKVAAASEASAPLAPPVLSAAKPSIKKERADAPVANVAIQRPDSAVVVAGQSVEGRSKAAGALASERRAFAADAAAPASPPPAPARAMGDSGARVVSGRIMTTLGAPAAGVQVTAVGPDGRAGTTTDSAGAYRLRVVGDSVMLLARQLGYTSTTRAVDLRRRDSARVDLKLEPASQQLSSIAVTSDRFVPAKTVEAPTVIATVPQVTMASGEIVQSNIVLGKCWSVRANGTPALRLPTHLAASSQVGSEFVTQWINWPSTRKATYVEMSNVRGGVFTGSSVIGRDTVMLTLTARGNDWTGLVVQRDGARRLEQSIVLTRVSEGVCKM